MAVRVHLKVKLFDRECEAGRPFHATIALCGFTVSRMAHFVWQHPLSGSAQRALNGRDEAQSRRAMNVNVVKRLT
jgi:hypothetical protein